MKQPTQTQEIARNTHEEAEHGHENRAEIAFDALSFTLPEVQERSLLLEVHDCLHEQHRENVDIQADQHQSPEQ